MDNDDPDEDHHSGRPTPSTSNSFYTPPAVSYDIAHPGLDEPIDDAGSQGSDEGGPEVDARYEWQDMLNNVLQGDVLKSEKTRLATASLSTAMTAKISGTGFVAGGNIGGRRQRAYAIWVEVRAWIRSRKEEEERRYLEEARAKVDEVFDEVLKFRVVDLVPPPDHPPISDDVRLRNAADQVEMLLRRVDWCESLYPSRRALALEKDRVTNPEIVQRIDALRSWLQITKRIKLRVGILKAWTGPEWELLSAPVYQRDAHTSAAGADRGFVANIIREDSLQDTFKKRLLSDVYSLVLVTKTAISDLSSDFSAMNLPGFASDLQRLAIFPSRLAQEALRNILESVQRLEDPSVVLIDQLTADLRKGLGTACEVKKQYFELAMSDDISGWQLPERVEEYEETLRATLKFFFKLLHWKLKSPSKAIYFKETEIVENEWTFLSGVTEQIEGGDLLVGEHFRCVFDKQRPSSESAHASSGPQLSDPSLACPSHGVFQYPAQSPRDARSKT